MRNDIQPYEQSFSSKQVAEEAGIATPTVRKYGQILERNGYEFLKDGDRRIFVQTDIEALIALRDTDKPLDDKAKDLANQQKERLEIANQTGLALPDTYNNVLHDSNQLKEFIMLLSNELAATREMNVQLLNDMSQLKKVTSRLQQDHHDLSSSIGNSAQKTNVKIEKLSEQQKNSYEALLQQEQQKSEFLQREIQHMRDEQRNEWRLQNDFNKRLEKQIQNPKEKWMRFLDMFRK